MFATRIILAVIVAGGIVDGGQTDSQKYVPGEVIVRFSAKQNGANRSMAERNAFLAARGAGIVTRSSRLAPNVTLVKLPDNLSVEEAIERLHGRPEVVRAVPNHIVRAYSTYPDDPNFGEQWALNNTGQTGGTVDADIDAPEAWDIRTSSGEIIVAVIDTGVDYNHPDLADNMWVNEAELNGEEGVDDDENGFIDDIYGYDFENDDGDPLDDNFHGTYCAGIISAVGDNNEGVSGVCWNTKIMALKFLNSSGSGNAYDAAEAIRYAIKMGANVLSNSWGSPWADDELEIAIEEADANGILFVAAAGNPYDWEEADNDDDQGHRYPPYYDCNNIIAVMATDHNDERSIWADTDQSSAYGRISVDLAAPGSDILTTFPSYETAAMTGYGFSTYYDMESGTSAAAPFVSGACALVWSKNPGLSHMEVKELIMGNVDKVDALEGLCVTEGRLNLYEAVRAASSLTLSVADDANEAVLPGDYVTYTISYANPVADENSPGYVGDVNDLTIVGYLPREIDGFDVNVSDGGVYNVFTGAVSWDTGVLSAGESNSVTVRPIFYTCLLKS